MSKKLNISGSGGTPKNTLLKYFTKSPAPEKKTLAKTPADAEIKLEEKEKENVENGTHVEKMDVMDAPESRSLAKRKLEEDFIPEKPTGKDDHVNHNDDEDDEKIVSKQGRKRRRVIVDSDDEEEERHTSKSKPKKTNDKDYSPTDDENNNEDNDEDDEMKCISDEAKSNDSEDDELKKKKLLRTSNAKHDVMTGGTFLQKIQNLQQTAASKTTSINAKNNEKWGEIVCSSSTLDEPVVWPHQKLEFLKPEKIKDKNGRRPDHADYDPGTLLVPSSFLHSLSPGVRQWWVLKTDNFDCVLFFKVGKFYELYHMDADVGVNELGFTYMRGEFAHSGFPEVSFDKMASVLVDRGYKVARVEQTETPDMMTERCKLIKPTKFDKVVRREVCQISNRGTQVFGSQCQITPNHQPNYMLAVVEKSAGVTSKYGVSYIDTSIGDFYVGEFDDDKNCSRLLTLLSHHMPVLVLYEKSSLSERTLQIWRTVLGNALKEQLPATEALACSAEKTLKYFVEQYAQSKTTKEGDDNMPLVLRTMQAEDDHLGLTPHDDYRLALKALGQCLTYLKKCHLEEKVLPMARYNFYTPPDVVGMDEQSSLSSIQQHQHHHMQRSHMVLDATTLANLRITGEEHSLLATLDKCCTKFGKRLLHHWLCAPSCDVAVIVERQRAITELLADGGQVLQELRALLAPLPDFDRHLAQIHLFGNKKIVDNHPDGRAVMFEQKLYNKKKIQNFIGILKGFKSLTKLPSLFIGFETDLLKRLTQLEGSCGKFPDMNTLLEFFKNAFDHAEAAKTGVIAPEAGVDAEYDAIEAKIANIDADLKSYLVEQEKYFGCRLSYFGSDKKRYQLDVPEKQARRAGKEYQLEGQRKGAKASRRYTTNQTRSFLKQMQSAEVERSRVSNDLSRRIFDKFSKHYEVWKRCVECVSNLDVLATLAEYARQQDVICVPELVAQSADGQPFIQLTEGYHPCVAADSFIPNGIVLGTDGIAPLSILTGPNMGGKSTLMREIGLLVVMAQIGAHIPAQGCRLSIVDRIFTRLGAQDDIIAGHSTFLVELNETSLILKHATANSLVLLDELGRGTATYDGTAIAASVVNHLADLKCRTLFSTHYHNLIDFFHKDPRITLGHMACMVENEGTEDPTHETVTFLYKYTAGACPKSYGFNAAKLAGMPHPIIKRAYELSKKVEAIALKRRIAAKFVACGGGDKTAVVVPIRNLLLQLRTCHV